MRFRVVAHNEEEFQQWIAGMRTPPEPFESGSAESQGELLFATNCKTCHSNDSWRQDAYALEIQQQDSRWATWLADIEDSRIVSAPNLTHYGERNFLAAGIKENSRENLIKWINDPSDIKIGTSMQAHAAVYQERDDNKISLSSQEVENIADYLLALQPGDIEQLAAPQITGGTPEERGEQFFVSIGCNACHSLDADTTIVGPSLVGIADRAGTRTNLSAEDYMRQSINDPSAFIVDGFTNSMIVPKLPPNQVDDLIAYISTLK